MTGPEHYEAAEHLLDMASAADPGEDLEAYYVAAAQAHATLALAAATALPAATRLRTAQGGSKADAAWSIAGIV